MKYLPVIKSAKQKQLSRIGKYHTVLFEEIVSDGFIEYAYILAVVDSETQNPCLFITSEVNAMEEKNEDCSHFLGIFDGVGHENDGASADWGDKELFTVKALRIVSERLGDGLSGPPKPTPKPWETQD